MSPDHLTQCALIDRNFNLHSRKIPTLCAGMQVTQLPGLSYVDSGLPCDTFNVIHITDGGLVTESILSQTLTYFQERELAYCIWISREQFGPALQQLFTQYGLQQQNAEPGMLLDLHQYQPTEHPLHANIQLVQTEATIRDFAEVIACNWTPPDEHVRTYYRRTAGLYLEQQTEIRLAVYYEARQPGGVVELFSSGPATAGIYGLATLADFRGRGIGNALMSYALTLAKKLGYQQCILQASADGIGIYRKLGFEVATVYYEYV